MALDPEVQAIWEAEHKRKEHYAEQERLADLPPAPVDPWWDGLEFIEPSDEPAPETEGAASWLGAYPLVHL